MFLVLLHAVQSRVSLSMGLGLWNDVCGALHVGGYMVTSYYHEL